MKIAPETVAAARAKQAPVNPFRFPEPPPGVVPKGAATMAQDDALGSAYGYAGNGGLIGGGEGLHWLGYPYLAELAQRPEYRRISEIIAREMTRRWIKITAKGDEDKTEQIEQIEEALHRLHVRDAFRQAAAMDGFFGRGQIFIDVGTTDNATEQTTPLTIDARKIGVGALKGLRPVEPVWTYPTGYNAIDPLSGDYYKPRAWFVFGRQIHASRMLTFVGRELPDLLKPAYNFSGLSMSQLAKPYVDNWLRTRQAVTDLIASFSVSGIKTDMSVVLQGGGAEALQMRAELFNATRNNRGLMLLDKGSGDAAPAEEFFNISTPLSGLDQLQAQAQEHMASVCGIPLIVLLGISPAGLNASSEGELRTFYDSIHSQQEHLFRTNLERVLKIVQLSLFGTIDESIRFKFEPLWQLDSEKEAAVQKMKADTHAVYLDHGVLDAEDVRMAVAGDEESPYAGIDLSGPPPTPPAGPEPDMLTGFQEHEEPGEATDPAEAMERQAAA
nr:DUF1073 domain-containing protein [uncultured Lichenicoccus sp.]